MSDALVHGACACGENLLKLSGSDRCHSRSAAASAGGWPGRGEDMATAYEEWDEHQPTWLVKDMIRRARTLRLRHPVWFAIPLGRQEVKLVDLIEVTAEDLDGVAPRTYPQLIIGQVRYRVAYVQPRQVRSARGARPDTTSAPCAWKLLLEQGDTATGSRVVRMAFTRTPGNAGNPRPRGARPLAARLRCTRETERTELARQMGRSTRRSGSLGVEG
jgi:hypothetical protein